MKYVRLTAQNLNLRIEKHSIRKGKIGTIQENLIKSLSKKIRTDIHRMLFVIVVVNLIKPQSVKLILKR